MMDRRTFIGGVAGGLLAAPFAARPQQMGKVYRIGILEPIPDTQNAATWTPCARACEIWATSKGKT